ncbi:MAG: 1-acyl-sn-glycerol-3-phosphate acyltransferase [Paludibacteraceae bacterium]
MADIKKKIIDVDEVMRQKVPDKKIPQFLIKYLKKILHQDDLNDYLHSVSGQKNLEFIESSLKKFDVSLCVEGEKNLPPIGGKYIFVSNHPLGGLDGVALGKIIGEPYGGKVRFFANDFLMFVDPLKEMFIPINKVGAQSKEISKTIDDFFKSDYHLITFPAGACSRKIKGEIKDFEWKKTFIAKAVQYKRDVIPIHFEARNSKFFYNLANLRTKLRVKLNVEMMYLADEMYKQKGNTFRVKIGETIPYQMFDRTRTQAEWANWVRAKVYGM